MTRTQIQLPNDLYRRAKRFAEEREISLAELMRRGLELWLERYPEESDGRQDWKLPKVNGKGLRVPLAKLRDLTAVEEETRGVAPE